MMISVELPGDFSLQLTVTATHSLNHTEASCRKSNHARADFEVLSRSITVKIAIEYDVALRSSVVFDHVLRA